MSQAMKCCLHFFRSLLYQICHMGGETGCKQMGHKGAERGFAAPGIRPTIHKGTATSTSLAATLLAQAAAKARKVAETAPPAGWTTCELRATPENKSSETMAWPAELSTHMPTMFRDLDSNTPEYVEVEPHEYWTPSPEGGGAEAMKSKGVCVKAPFDKVFFFSKDDFSNVRGRVGWGRPGPPNPPPTPCTGCIPCMHTPTTCRFSLFKGTATDSCGLPAFNTCSPTAKE